MTSWLERGGRAWISHGCQTCPTLSFPKGRHHGPARGSWPGHDSLLRASGLQGENLLLSELKNRLMRIYWVSVTGTRSQLTSVENLSLFHRECLRTWPRSWKISAFTDMMDGFGGTGEEGGDRARNAVMTAMPVHHCSFSQSGSHYFLAVAKMLLNGRMECEGESRSLWLSTQLHRTHNQPHFPLGC